jgi:pyrrolidone-carboxylate peptidase
MFKPKPSRISPPVTPREPSRAAHPPGADSASPLLDLQRTVGNELTGRMIGGALVQAKPLESSPGSEASPGEAPGETPAEPAAEPAAESGPAPDLVVDDSAETVGPGQMTKGEFFTRLRTEVCAAAEAGLAGTEHSAQGCPLIEFWLGYYEGQEVERINRDLPRFAGDGPRPTTAAGYIALITARVRTSVETWARTGEVTGVPPGLPLPGMGLPGLGALGGLLGGAFFKARPGGPRDPGDPRGLQADLGDGRPLDGALRSRMESAFGRSFSGVQVHTDSAAQGLAGRLNARAFTVGEHVAFGAREYHPGTLAGDALIAHELAHVAQQASGEATASGAGYESLERDADLAAVGATAALWGGLRGQAPLPRPAPRLGSGLRLQRCRRCEQTSEEAVLDRSDVPKGLLAASGFDRFQPAFQTALDGAADLQAAKQVVDAHARDLWQAATRRAQPSATPSTPSSTSAPASAPDTDDRPLYWARLQMTRTLRRWGPHFSLESAEREALIRRFEQVSRGMDPESAAFQSEEGVKRILISGFDPFSLKASDPSRGNPSGAAVLALDNQQINGDGATGEVQGVIFPVRYEDFNAGAVESFFGPYVKGAQHVDMIMTISQGASPLFEVEQYAGRNRSSEAPDNLGQTGGGTPTSPAAPPGLARGDQFLPTHLPAPEMRGALGTTDPLVEETEVREIPRGETAPVDRPTEGPTPGSTAVTGSGGGYLSNEIFYRTSLLRVSSKSQVPLGHLHTPYMRPASEYDSRSEFARVRDEIVSTVRRILEAVLPRL